MPTAITDVNRMKIMPGRKGAAGLRYSPINNFNFSSHTLHTLFLPIVLAGEGIESCPTAWGINQQKEREDVNLLKPFIAEKV